MTFAEKFKEERVKKELTQQQVADSLGITRKMITLYEKGTSLPRTRDAYKKIADFFGVETGTGLGGWYLRLVCWRNTF